MATYTFSEYLTEISASAENLRNTMEALRGIAQRHSDKGFGTLLEADFAGTGYTKVEYDALVAAVANLLNVWWNTHGAAIEDFLTETPGV